MTIYRCRCGKLISDQAQAGTPCICPNCMANINDVTPARRGATCVAADPPLSSAIMAMWLPVALTIVLLPAWLMSGAVYRIDVLGTLVSPWLVVALGLLISIRAGTLDFSVWAGASLGAVLTWLAVSSGMPAIIAVLLALLAGATAGLLQALAVRVLPFPAFLLTIIAGLAIMALSKFIAFSCDLQRLHWEQLGLFAHADIRLLLVAILYGVVLTVLLVHKKPAAVLKPEYHLPAGLIASSILAFGGGAIILLGSSAYVGRAFLLGDLRVLASVLLTGAWVWRSSGGLLLTGLLLPVSLLATTIWREMVWDVGPLPELAFDFSIIVLMIMTAGVQGVQCRSTFNRLARRWGGRIAWSGVLITALGAYFPTRENDAALALRAIGGATWLAGLLIALLWRRNQHDLHV